MWKFRLNLNSPRDISLRHARGVNSLFKTVSVATALLIPHDRLDMLDVLAKIFTDTSQFYKNSEDGTDVRFPF